MIEKYAVNGNEMILLGFGLDDNQETKNIILSNAKLMSVLFQEMLPSMIKKLISKETKGHDFVDCHDNQYEMKNATNSGGYAANLRESRHVGSGGKKRSRFNPSEDCDYYLDHKWDSDSFYYIITDIRNPPEIKIYIAPVKELLLHDLINLNCNEGFGCIKQKDMPKLDDIAVSHCIATTQNDGAGPLALSPYLTTTYDD